MVSHICLPRGIVFANIRMNTGPMYVLVVWIKLFLARPYHSLFFKVNLMAFCMHRLTNSAMLEV